MCTVPQPPGVNPIAVKYICHIISWGMLKRKMLQRKFLSIKSGCYNERGGILSAEVALACA
jgi:hypothetical protein